MNTVTYTHKGWFGVCPIYLGDIEGDCNVTARHDALGWLMDLSQFVIEFAIYVKTLINPNYEPMFPMCVTGELSEPIVKARA